jgi:colicin import membrane protein
MAKIAASRPKRSRTDVEKEFSKIAEEEAVRRESTDSKAEESARVREAETRRAVEGLTAEGVVQRISGLSLDLTHSLSELSAKLVAETESLNELREAVGLEKRELERLHKIDVAVTAIDHLVQDYHKQKSELEAEISAQREAWTQEELTRAREQKEAEEALKKQRQRESEEFEYKKALERKKALDKYDEDVRLQEKKNKEKQESLEKSWSQREAALKEKEEEWARLKTEVDAFPARFKKEVDGAVASALKVAEQKNEQLMIIFRKDAEADKRVSELQIKGLQETVSRQFEEIAALQKQLEEAKRQVQDIAVKAIEGASGSRALAHVNQIAIEQAKNRSPQS